MKKLVVSDLPLDRKVLIEASAGTGKTYTIGLIVLRLLLEKIISVEKIILVTFTEATAVELRKKTSEKLNEAYSIWKSNSNDSDEKDDLTEIIENVKNDREKKQLREANLLDAIARIDELPVFTIHGFCKRLLSEFALEIGIYEEVEMITDQRHIKDRIVADFWRREIQNLNEAVNVSPANLSGSIHSILNHLQAKIKGEDYEQSLKDYKNGIENAEKQLKYAIACKLAGEVREKLKQEREKLKVMDFNDLIEKCYEAVNDDDKNRNILQKAVIKRYDAILVDEFQDTDKMQFKIFDYLFKGKPFFMIGDPKQAIYRFRGGDIFAYKEARHSAKEENQFEMDKNYRSEEPLLDALNYFFGYDSFKQKMGEGIPYIKVKFGGKQKSDTKYKSFVIWEGGHTGFEKNVQNAVIAEIKQLLGTGIELKDIAILLNSNSACLKYKNALTAEGIFAIVKGGSVFASEAAIFLKVLLNAICHNNTLKYIRALFTNNLCGFEPKDITDKCVSIIYETKTKLEKHGIMNAIDFFMTKQNLWGQIAVNPNGERNITNIRQLMELLSEEEIKFGKIPEKINNRFTELCNNAEKNEEAEERLETDEEALKIMTIHKSKGLEFNFVFVPKIDSKPPLNDFPIYMHHKGQEKIISYFAKNENAEKANNDEENEEKARLLYVALTRAKSRLYVAYKKTKSGIDEKMPYCRKIFYNFCDDFRNSNTCENIEIKELDKISKEWTNIPRENKNNKIGKQPKPLPNIFPIKPTWQKTSFTEISKNLEHTAPPVPQQSELEIKIPSGKRIGVLLHSIFENLDFNANEVEIQDMVKRKLGGYKKFSDDDGEERIRLVKELINTILNKNLFGSAEKLCEVKDGNKIAELDFLMKSENINLEKIKEIMKEKIHDFEMGELPSKHILSVKYIKGAIDLVFLGKDGKYYILDWKSNSLSDFSQKGMEETMIHSGYHLQYYIYAVALKRWLEKMQENFNFKEKFGGTYYIFIRGVNNENSDGIYFANGSSIVNDILELDKCFNGEC
jgi:exodeoxyribonuclease V beta subunit